MRALLEKAPVMARGRLECEVANRLNLGNSNIAQEKVKRILSKLELNNEVVIERSGSILRGVTLTPQPAAVSEFTIQKSDKLRFDAYKAEVTIPKEEPLLEKAVSEKKEPLWVSLSLALLALQTAADDKGVVTGASAPIIARELNIPIHKANMLNGRLGKLGLRQTSGSKAYTVHQINMSVKEITREMLETPEDKPMEVRSDDEVIPSETAAASAEPLPYEQRPLEEQLADIIEALEKERSLLKEQLESLEKLYDDSASESARVINNLAKALKDATTENDEIRRRLAAVESPSERVKSIISRHSPESPSK